MPVLASQRPNTLARCTSRAARLQADAGIIEWHRSGVALAEDLHQEAVRLANSRAYEFSRDIYWLDQCAAVVAYVLGGRDSALFQRYAEHVRYYRNFESSRDNVAEFEAYVYGDAGPK
jgi:hypothetical protein